MGAQFDNIQRNLERLQREIYLGTRDGLTEEGENILEVSQTRDVPIAEGKLKDSGQLTVVDTGSINDLQVVISYGDSETQEYALVIHESPEFDPPSWADGVQFKHGGPKYLERPLFEAEDGMIERIAAKVIDRVK